MILEAENFRSRKMAKLFVVFVLVTLLMVFFVAPVPAEFISPLPTPTYELTPPYRPTPTPGVPPWLITPEAGQSGHLFTQVWLPLIVVMK
jgi:hypothetical protein